MICTSSFIRPSVWATTFKKAIFPGASTPAFYVRTPLPKRYKHTSTPSLLYSPKASLLASTWPTGTVGRSSSSLCPEISNPTFEPVFVVALPRRGLSSAVSSTKKSTFGLAKTSAMRKSMLQQRWKRGGDDDSRIMEKGGKGGKKHKKKRGGEVKRCGWCGIKGHKEKECRKKAAGDPLRQRFDRQRNTSDSRNLVRARAALPASSTPHPGALLLLYSTTTPTSPMMPTFGPLSP